MIKVNKKLQTDSWSVLGFFAGGSSFLFPLSLALFLRKVREGNVRGGSSSSISTSWLASFACELLFAHGALSCLSLSAKEGSCDGGLQEGKIMAQIIITVTKNHTCFHFPPH